MHAKIVAWLQMESDKKKGSTNFKRLVELIAVNYGQIDISRLGAKTNETVWEREGLTPNEALELTGMIQFFFGCVHIIGEADNARQLHDAVQREIARIERRSVITLPTTDEINVISKGFKAR